jgi:hypothetical protein
MLAFKDHDITKSHSTTVEPSKTFLLTSRENSQLAHEHVILHNNAHLHDICAIKDALQSKHFQL